MQPVKKQEFDFTTESNDQELKSWEDAVRAIPLPKKHFWLNQLGVNEEDKPDIAFTATYQYIDLGADTWFWLSLIFLNIGKSKVDFLCSYTSGAEGRLKIK